jgi:hypothetical protein
MHVAGTTTVAGTRVVVELKKIVPLIGTAAACGSDPLKKVPEEAGKAETPLTRPTIAIARYLMLVRQGMIDCKKRRDGSRTRMSDGLFPNCNRLCETE